MITAGDDLRPWNRAVLRRDNEIVRHRTELPRVLDIDVTTKGDLPGAADYARDKIGQLGRLTRRPVLYARVKLTRHSGPAVDRPVVAQANLDVDGRLLRAQADGVTAREAIDRLDARLRIRLERVAEHWDTRRRRRPADDERGRRESEARQRLGVWPRPAADRKIMRRKAFTLAVCTVDDAVREMDLLDYDFHLFTEKGTGVAGVIYRAGPTGYRLAQVIPPSPEQLAPFEVELTISPHPAPCTTVEQAAGRLGLLGLPFLFFIDAAQGRASVLYHRFDGHYGLITPAA